MTQNSYVNNVETNGSGHDMEVDSIPKIDFYTSRITPYCRAVKMLATHLNIPLNEIYVRPFSDTASQEFKTVSNVRFFNTGLDTKGV